MPRKHFTYRIGCSFTMQFTFDESEIEQSDDGDERDVSPTDEALEALRKEIEESLVERFPGVGDIDVSADFDDLLGVEEE